MKKTHFIAIGGAIMHQLALDLQKQGYHISGSDDEINDPARTNLQVAGLLPEQMGWFPDKITSDIDEIVLGMHAKADNPELLKAQTLGIPIYSFPEYVYNLSQNKKRVVVAGSHGKTSITSMIMHVLRYHHYDFDYLVGAKLEGFEQSVKISNAPLIILEGDEYPASVIEKKPKIFFYQPHISVLSGIAWDHINVFPTYDNYCSQFTQYLEMMPAQSRLFYNAEDPEVLRIVAAAQGQFTASPYHTPAFYYKGLEAVLKLEDQADIALKIFGKHNLLNLNAAKAVLLELGLSEQQFYEAIAGFKGASKRLEKFYESRFLTVFRDFAHAPSKLKATLDAVKEALPKNPVIACFELHTFSSLNETFLKEYQDSMRAADYALVYFSHHALQLKGLAALDPLKVKHYFNREDLIVIDQKEVLEQTVYAQLKAFNQQPCCLLLMSSGVFDGIQWDFDSLS